MVEGKYIQNQRINIYKQSPVNDVLYFFIYHISCNHQLYKIGYLCIILQTRESD